MNYLDSESISGVPSEEELIEQGLDLLPLIGASLFAGISHLGQAFHLTPAQVKVLLHFGVRERMTVGEIATALAVSMPAASELVDRLVDAGHLVRAADPADRRRVFVSATPEAQEIGAALRELRRAQLQHAMAELRPDERPSFARFLRALVVGLKYGTDDGMPCASLVRASSLAQPPSFAADRWDSAGVNSSCDSAARGVLS